MGKAINAQRASVRFCTKSNAEFNRTLKKRVQDYFKENKLSRFANFEMVSKTIIMIAIYLVPFILMLTGVITNIWLIMASWIIMGIGMAGIGMGVMHDANHGSYSKNETVNKILGRIIILVGGFAANWKIQHNILHHSYTNIHGMDEDIDAPAGLLRFSPDSELKKAHRYQHWYAWFFYGLLTLSWSTNKDFVQISRYKKMGLTETQNAKFKVLMTELIIDKLIYYGFIVALPIIFIDIPWWQTVIMILMMHFTAGLILSTVFQLAHVIPDTQFPQITEDNKIENDWMVHQLETTANFAHKNRLLNWFVGGLNHQVEHHLFPNICHVHYRKIASIVQKTALEYGIPYNTEPSFFKALRNHVRMLKSLGRPAVA
ncbi:MAG: acyl-CoA desaturase [Crocinitomicaceae bacterium]|nr:acyl-CoA desaturase [Crocinitomicaceae bacterium]